jgi:hypothetical protein
MYRTKEKQHKLRILFFTFVLASISCSIHAQTCPKLEPLFPVFEKTGIGFIDRAGKIIIPPKFLAPRGFSCGLTPFYDNKKWGYLDTAGTATIAPEFESADEFSEGLASVKKDGKYGYIDTSGKFVIAAKYSYASPFKNGRGRVSTQAGDMYVDSNGNEKPAPEAYISGPDKLNSIFPKKGAASPFKFRKGQKIVRTVFRYTTGFIDGYAHVLLDDADIKYKSYNAIINAKGYYTIPPTEDFIGYPINKMVSFMKKGKAKTTQGILTAEGQVVIKPVYEHLGLMKEGLCCAMKDGRWYYLDEKGGISITLPYPDTEFCSDFEDGLARVRTKKKEWTYIMRDGRQAFDGKFQEARGFENGLASVSLADGKLAYIDRTGKIIYKSSASLKEIAEMLYSGGK